MYKELSTDEFDYALALVRDRETDTSRIQNLMLNPDIETFDIELALGVQENTEYSLLIQDKSIMLTGYDTMQGIEYRTFIKLADLSEPLVKAE